MNSLIIQALISKINYKNSQKLKSNYLILKRVYKLKNIRMLHSEDNLKKLMKKPKNSVYN